MPNRFTSTLTSALLARPALSIVASLLGGDKRGLHRAIGDSGQWAARCLIATLSITSITSITMLFKGRDFTRWLRKSRRHVGVAAFADAALHLTVCMKGEASRTRIQTDVTKPEYLIGWTTFAVVLPLAATPTDWAVRNLGTWRKPLQRWVYAAAAGVLLHWSLVHGRHGLAEALLNFSPWFALSACRLRYWYLRPRPSAPAAGTRPVTRPWSGHGPGPKRPRSPARPVPAPKADPPRPCSLGAGQTPSA